MPSLRELAGQLIISHLTVKKAYDLLAAEGIITTLRGRGTFVVDDLPGGLRGEGLKQMRARARELADTARLLGIEREDWLAILNETWHEE